MKYFSTEEANLIIEKSGVLLCTPWKDNPNLDAVKALVSQLDSLGGNQGTLLWAAGMGFSLGRATGVREERARRKEATA